MTGATRKASAARELCRAWQNLLNRGELSPELEYRIQKMLDRMNPIMNKIYLKTAKGQAVLLQCLQKTQTLQDEVEAKGTRVFHVVTDLEKVFEDLLKTTYAFRVRGG